MMRSDPRGTAPVRTCVGCRQRDRQDHLLRIAAVAGAAVVDPRRRLPGRGAYVHASRTDSCVVRAARGGLARALRVEIDRDAAVELQRAVARAADEKNMVTSQVGAPRREAGAEPGDPVGGETCQAKVQAR